ncbi:MAG: glycosyltransferase [Candidatus Parvarchaeota archaeon]
MNVESYSHGVKTYDAVFLGNLQERKGIKFIAPVWKRVVDKLPEAKLIIMGEGPEKDKLSTEIRSLGLQKNIDILGFVSDEKKKELLSKSKLLFFPSILEGFSVAVVEAMASGAIPVIWDLQCFNLFNRGVIKVKYPDINEYSEKIINILNDGYERDKMNKEASKFLQDLTWDKASKLEYNNILDLFSTL